MTTSIYLAHLNPVTNAHVEIIKELRAGSDLVKVMPVIFYRGRTEVNSRSFPFSFEIRKAMLESVFGDSVEVSGNYAFYAPFSGYMPPLLSRRSWSLRRQILDGIEEDYFTYTGDRSEWLMLRLYRLNPRIGKRKILSASSVRETMYGAVRARADGDAWTKDVPGKVAEIIRNNWGVVEKFSEAQDMTRRIMGMKFPRDVRGESVK